MPKVCLMEVLRKGKNSQPTGWLQENNKIFINGGRPNFLEELLSDRPFEELLEEMRDVLKTIWDGEIQQMWSEIERWTFNKLYRDIKTDIGTENYLHNNLYREKKREIWSSIRCGTINRVGKINKSWFCKEEYEALTLLFTCEHIKSTLGDEWFN